MTEGLEDLVSTLEDLRKKKYPNIPNKIVREIVEAEFKSVEQRSQALRRVKDIIESNLDEESV
jgi:cellulose biosynthesis protein BcsQ